MLEPPHLEGLVDLELHLLDFKRLLHVVEGADLHRLDCRLHRPEGGHQDHGDRGLERLGCAQHIETVAASHFEIAYDDVELATVQLFDGGVAVRGFLDVVPGLAQCSCDSSAQRIVVVRDEDACPRHGSPLLCGGCRSPPQRR